MTNSFINFLIVGAGSCLGGMARYAISLLQAHSPAQSFPKATLATNLAGCLIIGLVYGIIQRGAPLNDGLKLFLTIGFCGGFTTYSTFINENFRLLSEGQIIPFLTYTIASLVGGFILLWVGYRLGRI